MENNFRILVVDDEESLRIMLGQVLQEDGYEVTAVATGEEALAAFRKNPFPLIITDIKMPGISGIDLLQKIKQLHPDTEVIIITSHASMESSISALRLGAYDYLVKPFEDLHLVSAVTSRAIEKIEMTKEIRNLIEKLEEKNQELEKANKVFKELAIRDGLTDLYNHRYFQEALGMELFRSQRYKHTFSLIFLDVDHFKHYNDTNGHPEGDQLLTELARIVKECLRESDLVSRYGGEEFVVILPETSKKMAYNVAENIRQMVADYPFNGKEKQPTGRVTISMGVATFPEDRIDRSSLLQAVDRALYKAKSDGRNLVICYKS